MVARRTLLLLGLLASAAHAWLAISGARGARWSPPSRCVSMSDEGADAFDMGLLSQRMDEVRDADAARQATRMVNRASNWRDGRCAQRTRVDMNGALRQGKV